MKTIELVGGLTTVVDDEDYERLSRYTWHAVVGHCGPRPARSIVTANGARKQYMARVIMGAGKGQEVDHINRNVLDNRRSNLRLCTAGENRCNAKRHRNKRSSRYKGVYRERGRERWRAIIGREYRTISLGTFATEEEAALAYNAAAERYHGEFARLNNIAGNEFRNARQSGFLGREPLAAGSEGRQ